MILATPFDPATRLCTGPSEPSGFDSLEDVVALMGEPIRQTRAMVIYPGIVYSPIVFSLDGAVTSGVSSAATDPESADNVPN